MLLLFLLNLIYITFFFILARCVAVDVDVAVGFQGGPRSKIPANEHTHTKRKRCRNWWTKGREKDEGGSGMEGRRRINANTFASKCGRPGFIYTLYCNRACCRRCCFCCCCAAVALSTATTINTCSFVVGIKCLRTHTHTNTHSRTKFLMCMCYFFNFSALNLPNFHCTANN